MDSVRTLVIVLIVQVVLGGVFLVLAATGNLPFVGSLDDEESSAAAPARLSVDRFDSGRAFRLLRRQVELGPRPAGSRASRRLARSLRDKLPDGRYQRVPGGLRNVVGSVPGTEPERTVVVGAHYDTKDIQGFVGANDGAGGTAAVVELARAVRRDPVRPTVVFILFDGEELPRGRPESEFKRYALRGSKVAAPRYKHAEAAIVLDFIADKQLSIPREASSDPELWSRLRESASRVGAQRHFPDRAQGTVTDDHTPFLEQGVPAIDLIDFRFACFHRACDDMSAVSERSLDASGESVLELLRTL
jgi:glutaminyl-peptide cyclotransferase